MISDEMLTKLILEEEKAIVNMLPDPDEFKHKFSPGFKKQMKKLIWKTDHPVAYSLVILKRAACFFVSFWLVVSMLFSSRVEAEASIIDWVKEQFENAYHYFFVAEDHIEDSNVYCVDWLPDGYFMTDLFEMDDGRSYLYSNTVGDALSFTYLYGSDSFSVLIGDGEYEHKYVSQGNFFGELYLSKDIGKTNFITWTRDGAVFTVSGFVGEVELTKIAQSVFVEN